MLMYTICDGYSSMRGREEYRLDILGVEVGIHHAQVSPGEMARKWMLLKSWFDTTKDYHNREEATGRDAGGWVPQWWECLIAFASVLGAIILAALWVWNVGVVWSL